MTAPRPDIAITVQLGPTLTLLRRLQLALKNLTPVLAGPVNASVNDLLVEQFKTEGAVGGKKWAPLAPVTVRLRKRRGHGRGGILRDTNPLWASLTKLGLGPDAVKRVTNSTLERGTTVPYARWHQTGYMSKTFVILDALGEPIPLFRPIPKKIPARPPVPDPVPRKYITIWEELIVKFVEGPSAA